MFQNWKKVVEIEAFAAFDVVVVNVLAIELATEPEIGLVSELVFVEADEIDVVFVEEVVVAVDVFGFDEKVNGTKKERFELVVVLAVVVIVVAVVQDGNTDESLRESLVV